MPMPMPVPVPVPMPVPMPVPVPVPVPVPMPMPVPVPVHIPMPMPVPVPVVVPVPMPMPVPVSKGISRLHSTHARTGCIVFCYLVFVQFVGFDALTFLQAWSDSCFCYCSGSSCWHLSAVTVDTKELRALHGSGALVLVPT